MGFIQKIKNAFTVEKSDVSFLASLHDTEITNPDFFSFIGGGNYCEDYSTIENAKKAFIQCAPVAYILYKQALAFSNGIITAKHNDADKMPLGKLNYQNILANPNATQTQLQFKLTINIYTRLYGWCAVLKQRDTFMNEGKVIGVNILAPHNTVIKYKSIVNPFVPLIQNIEKLQYKVNGGYINIDLDDVYFFLDSTINITSHLLPINRIASVGQAVDNIIKCYESKGVLIDNRGALGILSNDARDTIGPIQLDPTDKEQLQKDYKKYGTRRHQYPLIITSASVKYQQIASTMKDLMLDESIKADVMTLCNEFAFPYVLLAEGSQTTYENQATANVTLYENSVMPDANNFIEQFNECMEGSIDNIVYSIEFGHLECFQHNRKEKEENKKLKVSRIIEQFKNNLITYKAAMEELEQPFEKIPDLFFYQMPDEFKQSFKTNASISLNN